MKKNVNLRENEIENKVMPKEQQIHRKKKRHNNNTNKELFTKWLSAIVFVLA